MINMRTLLTAVFLITLAVGSQADDLNGKVTGTVDSHTVEVAVTCNRQKLGSADWLTAYSEPLLHSRIEDRNGDGIAISVSSNGEQAVFEVLVADQTYKFSAKKDLKFSATGLEVQSTIRRYEGKGMDQKVIGEYRVDLNLDCP
jgi:uncharacterized membrane protein YciS (DUF1049 family)